MTKSDADAIFKWGFSILLLAMNVFNFSEIYRNIKMGLNFHEVEWTYCREISFKRTKSLCWNGKVRPVGDLNNCSYSSFGRSLIQYERLD